MSKKKAAPAKTAAKEQSTGPMTAQDILNEIHAIRKQKADYVALSQQALANAQQCDGAIKAYEHMLTRLGAQEMAVANGN